MLQEFSIVGARTEGYKELAYPLGKKKTGKSITPLAAALAEAG